MPFNQPNKDLVSKRFIFFLFFHKLTSNHLVCVCVRVSISLCYDKILEVFFRSKFLWAYESSSWSFSLLFVVDDNITTIFVIHLIFFPFSFFFRFVDFTISLLAIIMDFFYNLLVGLFLILVVIIFTYLSACQSVMSIQMFYCIWLVGRLVGRFVFVYLWFFFRLFFYMMMIMMKAKIALPKIPSSWRW